MRIWDLLDVYNNHVVVKRRENGKLTQVLATRVDGGDFPFDLMGREITKADVTTNGTELALVIEYEA